MLTIRISDDLQKAGTPQTSIHHQVTDKAEGSRKSHTRAGSEGEKAEGADVLTLSAEGMALAEQKETTTDQTAAMKQFEEEFLKHQQEMAEKQAYQEQLEASQEAAKAFEDNAKYLEIARRIANGDKVPSGDEKKLMEFNPDLYQAAKAAALMNQDKKHKVYKSMFEDEENAGANQQMEGIAGSVGTASSDGAGNLNVTIASTRN